MSYVYQTRKMTPELEAELQAGLLTGMLNEKKVAIIRRDYAKSLNCQDQPLVSWRESLDMWMRGESVADETVRRMRQNSFDADFFHSPQEVPGAGQANVPVSFYSTHDYDHEV